MDWFERLFMTPLPPPPRYGGKYADFFGVDRDGWYAAYRREVEAEYQRQKQADYEAALDGLIECLTRPCGRGRLED